MEYVTLTSHLPAAIATILILVIKLKKSNKKNEESMLELGKTYSSVALMRGTTSNSAQSITIASDTQMKLRSSTRSLVYVVRNLICSVNLPAKFAQDTIAYSDLIVPETPVFLGKGAYGCVSLCSTYIP